MPDPSDSVESPPHRSLNVSEWPVVRKVALVLAIPLLLAVVLGGMRVQAELATASAATDTANQVTVLAPAVAYLSAAEDAAMVFRAEPDKAQRTAALKAVNDAAAGLEVAMTEADLAEPRRQQIRALLEATHGLRDGSAYSIVSTAVDRLSTLEAEITLDIAAMTDAGSSAASLIGLVGQLNEGRLAVTRQQLLVNPRPDVIPKNELFGLLGAESAAIGNLEQLLPDDASVALLRGYNASNFGLLGIGTPELRGEQPLELYDKVSTDLLGQVRDALSAQETGAKRTAMLTALLVGLALLLAVGAAFGVSRILVGPIRRVRDSARAVAQEQLPETVRRIRAGEDPGPITPVPVTTREEMGQLARAVDDLHGTAVRLARGEAELRTRVADMFVTLSRRNTSLVNQQLRLIEQLESHEEDPQRLESLFRLDHLASRMRRTAESLVVLADAPTQASEQDALSVDEALQAATAGVQDYQRVQVSGAPALRISGVAAPDVVHLFTELVDNALAFSPPTAPVRIVATTTAGLVMVEVEDAGLGIDPKTLAALNQTLRTGAEVSADTARRMGLFVVARLARRHGLTVTLEGNAGGGTTAKVFVPKQLLTSPGAPVTDGGTRKKPTPERVPELTPVRPAAADSLFRRPDEPAAPEPAAQVPTPAPAGPPSMDALSAVINANVRLPQRRPGAAEQPKPLTPVLPQRAPAVTAQPEPRPEPVEPARPAAPAVAAPAVDTSGGIPAYALDEHADDDETPLFRMLRSSWFAGSGRSEGWGPNEADAGWQAVDRVAEAAPSRLTQSGLPVRDPGHRLVPGGVAQAAPALRRDPEAIRARLAAHTAGVARGRSLAAPTLELHDQQPTETHEDVTP
jgi:signal transduction histidine kinase